jgi:hypothetical protein
LAGKKVTPHVLRHYVDGWVMWPAAMFPVAGVPLRPVPATFRPHNPGGYRQTWSSHSRRSWSAVQLGRGLGVSDW